MNWRLVFTGFQSLSWTLMVCAAIAVAVALFVMLRRYEARLVSPAIGRTLLTLRVLVLLLLLLTLLKPVLTKSWDEDQQSRLVIGFDVSESMDTADRHAAPAEMLRWAQALGMLGNDSTDAILNDWITAYESGKQPDWGQGDEQLGELRQRHVEGVFDELAAMSRTEFVRRLLQAKPNDLLGRLNQELVTDIQAFGMDHQSVLSDQLQNLLTSDRAEFRPAGTDAIGMLSNSIAEDDGNHIQGIVLFSDGRQTVKADAAAEAERLGSLGIPVYCVPIGSELSPRDLAIASVQVPQSVFLDDNVQMQATISASGFSGDDITVRLQKDGQVVDRQTVTVASDSFDVEFEIPTAEVGHHEYSLSMDVQAGELRDDNNARDFTVSVVDNKAKVLLVEGDARWEFRYLNSALERDKRVELSRILFDQPFLQLLNKPFLPSTLPDMDALTEQLSNTDILIVGDVDPDKLPESFWQAVEQAVANESITLLIIPGNRAMPLRYNSDSLQKLLPVTEPHRIVAERYQRSLQDAPPSAFHLHPTPAADNVTLFDLSSSEGEQRAGLAGLPGHPSAFTGTPKPIATVWANVKMDGIEIATEDSAAVVHQYYGFGQVLWFGIDSTWRWRRRAGDTWHHQFWGQVVRWAARNKSAAGNDQVRMTMSDVIIDETEGADVAVRWNPRLIPQLENAVVEVVVTALEDPVAADNNDSRPGAKMEPRRLQLDPVEETPERYQARLTGMRPGTYQVQLNVSDVPFDLDDVIETQLMVQKRTSTELANVSCNRDFLSQLSVVTGGKLLEPWDLSELPELVRPQQLSNSVVQEKTLWDHWLPMLLFFLLLTAEWILRKVNGLP